MVMAVLRISNGEFVDIDFPSKHRFSRQFVLYLKIETFADLFQGKSEPRKRNTMASCNGL